MKDTLKRILIINLGGIGDFLLSVPAIRAMRREMPDAEFSFLVSSGLAGIAPDITRDVEVFRFHIGYGGKISPGGLIRNLQVLLLLRSKRFDLAMNMRTLMSDSGAAKMRLLLDLIRPKKSAGRDTCGRGDFFDIRVPEPQTGEKYEMEYDIDLVSSIGVSVTEKTVRLPVEKEDMDRIERILEENGISGKEKIIGIHPGGMPTRRWPVGKFCKMIDDISKEVDSVFIITGGTGEAGLGDHIMEHTGAKVVSLAGKVDIGELVALISRCDLYISNDTGPMHIAAALDVSLIAIFGPGDLTRFDPRNISPAAKVFYNKVECAPCENVECGHLNCFSDIYPEEVGSAAVGLLRGSKVWRNRSC